MVLLIGALIFDVFTFLSLPRKHWTGWFFTLIFQCKPINSGADSDDCYGNSHSLPQWTLFQSTNLLGISATSQYLLLLKTFSKINFTLIQTCSLSWGISCFSWLLHCKENRTTSFPSASSFFNNKKKINKKRCHQKVHFKLKSIM